jgi:hypothetical protein
MVLEQKLQGQVEGLEPQFADWIRRVELLKKMRERIIDFE